MLASCQDLNKSCRIYKINRLSENVGKCNGVGLSGSERSVNVKVNEIIALLYRSYSSPPPPSQRTSKRHTVAKGNEFFENQKNQKYLENSSNYLILATLFVQNSKSNVLKKFERIQKLWTLNCAKWIPSLRVYNYM